MSQMASNIFCGGHGAAAQLVSVVAAKICSKKFSNGKNDAAETRSHSTAT